MRLLTADLLSRSIVIHHCNKKPLLVLIQKWLLCLAVNYNLSIKVRRSNNGFPKGASHPLVGVEGATPHRRPPQRAKHFPAPAGAALDAHLKGEF